MWYQVWLNRTIHCSDIGNYYTYLIFPLNCFVFNNIHEYANHTKQDNYIYDHAKLGILGQVWCLIVSIPDLCPLSYFDAKFSCLG